MATDDLPPDTLVEVTLLARFERATSVGVAPTGDLFVADAGRDAVVHLAADGREVEVLGGPGSDASRFDDPSGVDPTNGLVLLVADAGNGRIQRFARDGRFLEAMPVFSTLDPEDGDPEYMERDASVSARSGGQPLDVVSTDDGAVFVAEAISGTVRSWDRERRPGPAVGSGAGDDLPGQPVALATDGRRVYVADAMLPGIVVLDGFGRPTRTFGSGAADGIVSVAAGGGCIWMVLPDRVIGFSPEGTRRAGYGVELPDPLVDAAAGDDALYLVTARGLYRAAAMCDG